VELPLAIDPRLQFRLAVIIGGQGGGDDAVAPSGHTLVQADAVDGDGERVSGNGAVDIDRPVLRIAAQAAQRVHRVTALGVQRGRPHRIAGIDAQGGFGRAEETRIVLGLEGDSPWLGSGGQSVKHDIAAAGLAAPHDAAGFVAGEMNFKGTERTAILPRHGAIDDIAGLGACEDQASARACNVVAARRQFQSRRIGDLAPVHGVERPGTGDVGGHRGWGVKHDKSHHEPTSAGAHASLHDGETPPDAESYNTDGRLGGYPGAARDSGFEALE